jgi:iron complex outermembrane receptor protein
MRTSLLTLAALALLQAAAGARAQQTVVVTGNPTGRDRPAQPASVLAGSELLQRRGATLGDTLDGLPGVAATSFGPNSSRPVIRGLDGDRIRLLDNGGASFDASNLSFDHASATDPLVAERIEVLRGPAALLYGGNATGGVVNVIDNRIPRLAASGPTGRAELRAGGAAAERSAAVVLEGGDAGPAGSGLAWHADAFGRRSDDLRVPRFVPVQDGETLAPAERVRNSVARADGGAVGAGWAGRDGYAGVSAETLNSRYGVTVEPDITIRLRRDRLALRAEARNLGGLLRRATFGASRTDYEHREVEGDGSVGTVFKSRGSELRSEFEHAPLAVLGGVRGVLGLQAESLDFSALGDEAFVPATRTRSQAAFALEELELGALVLRAGLRSERVRVGSEGDAAGSDGPRFGPAAERRFSPQSASLSAGWDLGGGWHLEGALGHTERAPAYYELFANGLHVATGTFERGDATLGVERSRHAELGLGLRRAGGSLLLTVFETRFSRYIGLDDTGQTVEDGHGHEVPVYAFGATRARLRGLELDGRWRVREARAGHAWTLDLTGGADLVRGDDLLRGQPLPRLAPLRLRAGLVLGTGALRWTATVRHAARQDRVPANDSATAGWTMLDLGAGGPLPGMGLPLASAGWFVKLANATDRLGFNAGSAATVRGLAPLPGRALSAGVQLRF